MMSWGGGKGCRNKNKEEIMQLNSSQKLKKMLNYLLLKLSFSDQNGQYSQLNFLSEIYNKYTLNCMQKD